MRTRIEVCVRSGSATGFSSSLNLFNCAQARDERNALRKSPPCMSVFYHHECAFFLLCVVRALCCFHFGIRISNKNTFIYRVDAVLQLCTQHFALQSPPERHISVQEKPENQPYWLRRSSRASCRQPSSRIRETHTHLTQTQHRAHVHTPLRNQTHPAECAHKYCAVRKMPDLWGAADADISIDMESY